jgi:mannosyltransferase OCH1-like enzyme/GR25 family glycosyltransferase involved in LPS biosynthesis
MKIFCINLERASDRKNYMIDQWCNGLGLDIDFWSAYDKNFVNHNLLEFQYNDKKCHKFFNRSLSNGEIACAISFYQLFKYILNNNIEECIIMEDDIENIAKNKEEILTKIHQAKQEFPNLQMLLMHEISNKQKNNSKHSYGATLKEIYYIKKKTASLCKRAPWGNQCFYITKKAIQLIYNRLLTQNKNIEIWHPADYFSSFYLCPEGLVCILNKPICKHDWEGKKIPSYIGNNIRVPSQNLTIELHGDFNKQYKFGCVIGCYGRTKLLNETIQQINKSFIPKDMIFIIIDDASREKIQIDLNYDHIIVHKSINKGIANSLAIGWDILYLLNVEYLLNLDADTEISPNWLSSLLNVYQEYSSSLCIVTGFNGKFNNGRVGHPIISTNKRYNIKKSIGGINIFFHKSIYKELVRKSVTDYESMPGSVDQVIETSNNYGTNPKLDPRPFFNGWDWGLNSLCVKNQITILSPLSSVIQHKGEHGITSRSDAFEISEDYQSICVPKIIHQLWRDENIPDHLKLMQQSVIDNHPDYEYKLWKDSDILKFIEEFYPEMFHYYNSGIEHIIQQIDFIRLLLIYHYGGIYIDLDSICLKPVNDILNYPCSFINTKKHEAFVDKYYPLIINNAFIAAEKQNNFIKQILLHIIDYHDPVDYKEYCTFNPAYTKILKSAGPLCITDVYLKYQFQSMINLLPNTYYYGSDYDKKLTAEEILGYGIQLGNGIHDCHFIHLHESSWWRNNNNETINPPLNRYFDDHNLDIKKNMAKIELISK